MMKRSLGQQNLFAIFGTFGRYITNLRGTFVENVKKVKNQPTLVYRRAARMKKSKRKRQIDSLFDNDKYWMWLKEQVWKVGHQCCQLPEISAAKLKGCRLKFCVAGKKSLTILLHPIHLKRPKRDRTVSFNFSL
jgi:hypothetical protein